MNSFALFTDVSVNPRNKIGVGAYLAVPSSFIEVSPHSVEISAVTECLVVRRFEDTSSTKLEVQTVLWAMEDLKFTTPAKLKVYSDSQCVEGLLRRENRLKASGFVSRGNNRMLKNASLYSKFYEVHDKLGFEVIKVAGHISARSHDTVHRIFSFVDREVRSALHLWIDELDQGKK